MEDQELFTKFKNLHPSARYDVSKLGPTRAISGDLDNLYGKIGDFQSQIFTFFHFFSAPDSPIEPKMG